MDFLRLPFYAEVAEFDTILLAGAGGGFDIFSGLPLYFGLRAAGKTVYPANLSFSTLYASTGRRIGPAVVEVTAKTEGMERYFPELHLARWFAAGGEDVPIYCIDRTGVKPTAEAYRTLVEQLRPEAIILVDGGTDSLMRGDEAGLGTPQEDIASIAAVDRLEDIKKFLVCIGFGIDTYHGVCHAQFLEAVSDIIKQDGFLGAWSLTRDMPEVTLYRQATEFVHHIMFNQPSIVSSSILSALEGCFGDYHATYRTEGYPLFINPLMSLYWCFRLEAVSQRNLYLDQVRETETYQDLTLAIETYRALHDSKMWVDLPM